MSMIENTLAEFDFSNALDKLYYMGWLNSIDYGIIPSEDELQCDARWLLKIAVHQLNHSDHTSCSATLGGITVLVKKVAEELEMSIDFNNSTIDCAFAFNVWSEK